MFLSCITNSLEQSMHTYRLAVGSWRYRQLPTENRRSSVGVYRTPTRSSGLIGAIPPIRNLNRRKSQSALVGRCVPNVNPIVGANRQVCIEFRLDSTVGGKLTNHSYYFRARLDLAQYLPQLASIISRIFVIFASLFPSNLV